MQMAPILAWLLIGLACALQSKPYFGRGFAPPVPVGGSLTFIPDQTMVMFGGQVANSPTNDLSLFDLEAHAWTSPNTGSLQPPARLMHCAVRIDSHKMLV